VRSLANSVFETIRKSRILAPGDRAGVAVSGGADSVALLSILESLRDRLGITLRVVHFNHGLRGADSDGDAQFVEDLARKRGLECIVGREDVAATAAAHKWNLEDASRRLRYAFFQRLVEEGRATHITVAHTADDQAETVLAHILRGTGPAGLAGIYPAVGSVVRPLLGERREDLRTYLRELGQTWREDATNRDLSKQRARIRDRLLPLLERDFSPRAVDHLARLAGLAREEEIFWNALVEDRFRTLIRKDKEKIGVRIQDLLAPLELSNAPATAAPAALRTLTERLIRRIYEQLRGGLSGLGAFHVEQVIRLASVSTSGSRAELPGGILVERNFGDLIFSRIPRAARQMPRRETDSRTVAYLYVVSLPSRGIATVSVPELKSRFCLKVIDWSVSERDTKSDSAALDADLLREPLVLRSWRPGDAYRPRGRRRTKKLKEMFLAGRVPGRDRVGWPVLESAGRVVWARGLPPADQFCAREDTQAGLLIEEVRL
jgi:tRNA(Ile)-lysidine synthase